MVVSFQRGAFVCAESLSRDTPEIASLRLVCAHPCAQTVPREALGTHERASLERRVVDWRTLFAAVVAAIGARRRVRQRRRRPSLIEAARANDTTTALAAIADKVDVNAKSADGTTALHWAIYRDNLPLVQRLIKAGADVTTANEFGSTPMAQAAVVGDAAVIDALLDAGADVESRGRRWPDGADGRGAQRQRRGGRDAAEARRERERARDAGASRRR